MRLKINWIKATAILMLALGIVVAAFFYFQNASHSPTSSSQNGELHLGNQTVAIDFETGKMVDASVLAWAGVSSYEELKVTEKKPSQAYEDFVWSLGGDLFIEVCDPEIEPQKGHKILLVNERIFQDIDLHYAESLDAVTSADAWFNEYKHALRKLESGGENVVFIVKSENNLYKVEIYHYKELPDKSSCGKDSQDLNEMDLRYEKLN